MNPRDFEGLRLSSEEVAELTEQLFGWREPGRSEPGVPVESCLSLFEEENIPEDAIRAALEQVVHRREQRLSSILERKALELEKMLLGLLTRLDENFHLEIDAKPPGSSPRGRAEEMQVVFQIRSARSELEVRALEITTEGTRRLFTILVQGARPAGLLDRLVGKKRLLPPRVAVLEPGGMTLRSLLSMSLARTDAAPNLGRAVAVTFERLHDAVLDELDGALAFARQLRFEPEEKSRKGGR